MICYQKFPEPMKIMNISSLLRTLTQLLALLLALACTLPPIHAKVGEQENWYIDRVVNLEGFSDSSHPENSILSYFEDNGSEKLYKFRGSDTLRIWDFNGSVQSFPFPYDDINDPMVFTPYDGVVLPDGSFIFAGHASLLHARIVESGAIKSLSIQNAGIYSYSNAQYIDAQDSDWEINLQFDESDVHPDSQNIPNPELRVKAVPQYTYTSSPSTGSLIPRLDISSAASLKVANQKIRFSSPPSIINIDIPSNSEELEPLQATLELGSGILINSIDQNVTETEELGGQRVALSKSGKLLVYKRLHSNDGEIYSHLFKIYQIETTNSSPIPALSLIHKFYLETGSAPGQIPISNYYSGIADIVNFIFTDDDRIVFSTSQNSKLNIFSIDGNFIKRTDFYGEYALKGNSTGNIIGGSSIFNSDGESLGVFRNEEEANPYLPWGGWRKNGDIYSISKGKLYLLNRAYRTKGLPVRNIIPQPVVRSVTQRPGTNILDIDFEIIDPDDNTATAGLLGTVAIEDGYHDRRIQMDLSWDKYEFNDLSKLIIPSSLTDGTDSLIGQPIATNEVHRVSWYVKGDWSELTGDLKIGVFAQDARRSMPVDLHFLKIPTEDGNLTISRSPLKDSDMLNYFQYLLSIGDPRVKLNDSKIVDSSGSTLMEADSTKQGRDFFMNDLGYRWASIAELSIAREAATPGTVNEWDATNQIKTRNLPYRVNEYGFDTGNHGNRAWWVVKESP